LTITSLNPPRSLVEKSLTSNRYPFASQYLRYISKDPAKKRRLFPARPGPNFQEERIHRIILRRHQLILQRFQQRSAAFLRRRQFRRRQLRHLRITGLRRHLLSIPRSSAAILRYSWYRLTTGSSRPDSLLAAISFLRIASTAGSFQRFLQVPHTAGASLPAYESAGIVQTLGSSIDGEKLRRMATPSAFHNFEFDSKASLLFEGALASLPPTPPRAAVPLLFSC
jgi:hypothetical protein